MRRATLLFAIALTVTTLGATRAAVAQKPFIVPGEQLTYRVRSEHFGNFGTAELRVEGVDTVNGVPAHRLAFDFKAKVLVFKVSDETRSWLAINGLHTLRYTKRERSPVGSRDEQVQIDLQTSTWSTPSGSNELATSQPLDELSFIYLVRGLELSDGQELSLHRHFDERRNAVLVRSLGRVLVDGRAALKFEMRVPDTRQKKGSSVLRFVVSDDAQRVPLRIEASMPMAGTIIMTLQSVTMRSLVAGM